jgi:probable phosphoglycerate mutase
MCCVIIPIVLVGHDSLNRVLLFFALELALSHYWRLRQDPCSISELLFDDRSFIINSINQTQHLSRR